MGRVDDVYGGCARVFSYVILKLTFDPLICGVFKGGLMPARGDLNVIDFYFTLRVKMVSATLETECLMFEPVLTAYLY